MMGAMIVSPRTEHAVARSLAETTDPHAALARALSTIGESLGWQLGAAWEPAADRPEALVCEEVWHGGDAPAVAFEQASRETSLAPGEGLPGRVWDSGEPAWIADLAADENFPRAAAAGRAGMRSAICFPIRSARGVLGAIEFFTAEPRDPDPELLATMANLGDQIGQAVERRRDAEVLRAKDARLHAMLDSALDCVVTMDHEGRVIDLNAGRRAHVRLQPGDAMGRDMADLIIPPDLRRRHRAGLARYLKTRRRRGPRPQDRDHGDARGRQRLFPVELTITRIDVPGPPTFTGYLRDITDRKARGRAPGSRARIVEAADEARRRLERDLHDGAQQRLVELALDLRMARAQLDDDPGAALELLDACDRRPGGRDGRAARAGARHPPGRAHRGRPRGRARGARGRSTVPVRLVSVPDGRFGRAVEATAYFTSRRPDQRRALRRARARIEVDVGAWTVSCTSRCATTAAAAPTRPPAPGCAGSPIASPRSTARSRSVSPRGAGTVLRVEIPCAS